MKLLGKCWASKEMDIFTLSTLLMKTVGGRLWTNIRQLLPLDAGTTKTPQTKPNWI